MYFEFLKNRFFKTTLRFMNTTAVWDMPMCPVAGRYRPATFTFKPNYKASNSIQQQSSYLDKTNTDLHVKP